jgi:Zonular occludens toxin (Zot).
MKILRWQIEFNTFFKKGLPKVDDRFGVYFVTGRQGSGKSYYAVKLLLAQDSKTCNKVYTNVHSLRIPHLKLEYFDKIENLYTNTEEYCIFLIDEISRKYDKNSKTDTQFYAWLNQSRKRKRIVIMITQEWKELPMWIRRPAKYMFTTRPNFFTRFGIYTTTLGDAENMVLNKDEMEWECPPIKHVFYKRTKHVADMYDTFEAINTL